MSTVCACDECGYEACTKERQRVRVCLCVYCACVCSYRAGWVCMSKSIGYVRERERDKERKSERERDIERDRGPCHWWASFHNVIFQHDLLFGFDSSIKMSPNILIPFNQCPSKLKGHERVSLCLQWPSMAFNTST